MDELKQLLADQCGVVSRAQARTAGVSDNDLRRMARQRVLVPVHRGVYVDHTGALTWMQRAWAGVLYAWPGVLAGASALRAADGPGRTDGDDAPIEIAVDRSRRPVAPPGVVISRTFDLDRRARWNRSPPRLRYEEAALDVALAAAGDFAAIEALARAVQKRHTTAERMLVTVRKRKRVARRAFVAGVLDDVARGTCSVLEHGYLTEVERPHGLPTAHRQAKGLSSLGVVYRDASYGELHLELDGRLFHDTADQRDRDFERDLDAAVDGGQTVRLSWGQVYDRPCSTAGKVSRLLVARGWPAARPCGPGCAIAAAA